MCLFFSLSFVFFKKVYATKNAPAEASANFVKFKSILEATF